MFRREKYGLRRLLKTRDAVKYQYSLLKHAKDSLEKALDETFKSITDPLRRLVGIKKPQKLEHTITEEIEKKPEEDQLVKSDHEDDTEEFWKDDTLQTHESTFETAGEDDDDADVDINFKMFQQNSNLDRLYEVRREDDDYVIGNSPIYIVDDRIAVEDNRYTKSPGLPELLFAKNTDRAVITDKDLSNYRRIFEQWSAHKRRYKESGPLRTHTSNKYKHHIAKLFKSGEGLNKRLSRHQTTKSELSIRLPRCKIARAGTLIEYVCWDDSTELVDRLRL